MGYTDCQTKKDKIAYIRAALASGNKKWLQRALIVINNNQEEDEKQQRISLYANGVGFTGADARFSGWASQLNRTGGLKEYQWNVLQKKLPKYARQLYSIIVSKPKADSSIIVSKPEKLPADTKLFSRLRIRMVKGMVMYSL